MPTRGRQVYVGGILLADTGGIMSFDLMVFDPTQAPRLRGAFFDWFRAGTLILQHDYNSPNRLTAPLRGAYDRLRSEFPPRNGPDAVFEPAPPAKAAQGGEALPGLSGSASGTVPPAFGAEYSFADAFIYLSFLSDAADHAYQGVLRCAYQCEVGFFNASSDWGEILHDRAQFGPYLGF